MTPPAEYRQKAYAIKAVPMSLPAWFLLLMALVYNSFSLLLISLGLMFIVCLVNQAIDFDIYYEQYGSRKLELKFSLLLFIFLPLTLFTHLTRATRYRMQNLSGEHKNKIMIKKHPKAHEYKIAQQLLKDALELCNKFPDNKELQYSFNRAKSTVDALQRLPRAIEQDNAMVKAVAMLKQLDQIDDSLTLHLQAHKELLQEGHGSELEALQDKIAKQLASGHFKPDPTKVEKWGSAAPW